MDENDYASGWWVKHTANGFLNSAALGFLREFLSTDTDSANLLLRVSSLVGSDVIIYLLARELFAFINNENW